MKIMLIGINDPDRLAGVAAVIRAFPTEKPVEWGLGERLQNAHVLRRCCEGYRCGTEARECVIVASNEIAAAVTLRAPTQLEITRVIEQLGDVNARIKQDQRFAAALAIGVAVAGEVRSQLSRV